MLYQSSSEKPTTVIGSRVILSNNRYDAESSGPSRNWKGADKVFPFSAEQLIDHVRKCVDGIDQDESRVEEIKYSSVRGVYVYGSRTFKTNVSDSDFDFVFVSDDLYTKNCPEGGFSRNMQYMLHTSIVVTDDGVESSYDLEVMMMNTHHFVQHVYYQLPVLLLSVQQPDFKFVLYEDAKMKMWRENWNRWFLRVPRTRNEILHELNFSFNKAYRFWTSLQKGVFTTDSERKDALKKVRKNLAHGIRFCKYGYQIVFGGSIYDYLETNDLYDRMVYETDSFSSWDDYNNSVKPIYDKWTVDFKEDMKKIMKDVREKTRCQEKTDSLFTLDLLNDYFTIFSKGSTFDFRSLSIATEFDESYSFQYSFGPFSLNRVLSLQVTPLMHSQDQIKDPNKSTLFRLDFDPIFQDGENAINFFELKIYTECNGMVVGTEQICEYEGQFHEVRYKPVCVPRFYLEEYKELDKRFGENYTKGLKLEDYTPLEKPAGVTCDLFYYDGGWKFTYGNQGEKWINNWVFANYNDSFEQEVLSVWEELEMCFPNDECANMNFFFTYQQSSKRIIYRGCRCLNSFKESTNWRVYGKRFHWNDQVKELPRLDILSYFDLINDFDQYSPLYFEGIEFVNFNDEYRGFHIKSSLRSQVPFLRVTNTNYITSLIDDHIKEDPPLELITSKFNLDRIVSVIVQTTFSENNDDETVVRQLNPLFLKYFVNIKKKYLRLCNVINNFYSERLQPLENDSLQFNRECGNFLNGKVKKSTTFFPKLKRLRGNESVNIQKYWKMISLQNDRNSDSEIRFIGAMLDMV